MNKNWMPAIVLMFGIALLGTLGPGCGGPPSMGPDREVFTAIDALYTAVSLRDPAQLDRCAGTLERLHAEKRCPDAAFIAIEGMIEEARGGQWEDAQSRLRRFMLGQRG